MKRSVAFCFVIWGALFFPCLIGAQQAPLLINYQGRLTQDGTPITAPRLVQFQIFDDATSGSAQGGYSEILTANPNADGVFSLILGLISSVPHSIFSKGENRWLRIIVDADNNGVIDGTDPPLTPRTRLVSVPYAYHSSSAAFATNAGFATQAGSVANGSVTEAKIASGFGLLPSGAIIMVLGASCPPNFTRVTSMDGRFVQGAPTGMGGNTTGGNSTHAHTLGNHSHFFGGTSSFKATPYRSWPDRNDLYDNTDHFITKTDHSHTVGGTTSGSGATSDSADHIPPFITVIFCQRN